MTNFFVYDLETHNTDGARLDVFCLYRLSKLAGRYNKENSTPYEVEKSKNDTTAFCGDECVTNALDFCLKLKGEERKVKKIVEYNFQFHVHNGSGFDTWILSKNLSCDKHIVKIIKNGKYIRYNRIESI